MTKVRDTLLEWTEWIVRRNPTYLASAASMALGARLMLVSPQSRTGDIGLILITLGILQLYETTVCGALVVLHRYRRSPEDLPFLLLVAVAFWTGPLAATIEMTSFRSDLGLALALPAVVVALIEMRMTMRRMNFRVPLATQVSASALLTFLAVAPPLLKISEVAVGWHEVRMYYAWLGIAAITLFPLASRRGPIPTDAQSSLQARPVQSPEVLFLGITIAATVAHLVGMNHSFFAHAKFFYAAPLIVAIAVVGTRLLYTRGLRTLSAANLIAFLPGLAIWISFDGFHEDVPVSLLPGWLRDPLSTALAVAACGWWTIAVWRRSALNVHAANACAVGLFFRILPQSVRSAFPSEIVASNSGVVPLTPVLLIYLAAAYLLLSAAIRRSRHEALLGVTCVGCATILFVSNRFETDNLWTCITLGWCAWIGIHLAESSPRRIVRAAPFLFLCLTNSVYLFRDQFSEIVLVHSGIMFVALFVIGKCFPSTQYCSIAYLSVLANGGSWSAAELIRTEHPQAALSGVAAFALLAVGVLISWYKSAITEFLISNKGVEEELDRHSTTGEASSAI